MTTADQPIHFSPHCACGINDIGQHFVDPICRKKREASRWPDMPGYAGVCRNCRRPLFDVEGVGILHGELPQYAHRPITCNNAVPLEVRDDHR